MNRYDSKGISILVVDSHLDLADLLKDPLEQQGYEVTIETSGERALERCTTQVYHLVLLDQRLPDMSGIALMKELKERYPNIQVLITTGHGPLDSVVQALAYGAGGYLLKPWNIPQVLEKISEALAQQKERLASDLYYQQLRTALEEKEKYRKLFENAYDMIILADPETLQILEVNRRVEQMLGYSREELLNMNLLQISAEEEWEDARKMLQKTLGEGAGRVSARTYLHKNGSRIRMTVSVSTLEYNGRKVLQGVIREVTEKKKAEREREVVHRINTLLASNLNIQEVFQEIGVELGKEIEFDRMSVTLFNERKDQFELFAVAQGSQFENLQEGPLDLKEGTVLARIADTGEAIFIQDSRTSPFLMNENLIKAGIMSSLSVPLKYQGAILGAINLGSKKVNHFSEQHLSLLMQIAPQLAISIENSRLYLLIKQEKASLEEEVRKRTEELLQSKRLAALGELASSMAHEVRHPLLRIRLLVDQLKRVMSEESESEAWMDLMNTSIEGIIHEINQINTLVTDILDYSKPIKLNIIPLEVESIIESALSSIEEEAQAKGIKINREPAEPGRPMLEVNVDGNRIKQVLVNLFKNALDAMETGGQLLIRTSPLPDQVEVYIQDTGSGMSEEVLKRIFEPFYTTKEKGIGLGMAIAKRIIELHRGEIRVESTEGLGTAVRLRLPYGKAG